MAVIVLADLRGRGGFVNKDTVAGGYGSRFTGDSFTTRLGVHVRKVFQNVPSIHVGYLAAIFAAAGHKVIHTQDDRPVDGDLALVLTSLVDYKHECEWARAGSRARHEGRFLWPRLRRTCRNSSTAPAISSSAVSPKRRRSRSPRAKIRTDSS